MARSRTTGGKKLNALLRKLPVAITDGVRKEIKVAAEVVLFDALRLAPKPGEHPYATGELARKLNLKIDRSGLRARVGSWGRGRARHIHLVEFGTAASEGTDKNGKPFRHAATPAMPFLFPAHKKNYAANVTLIRKAIATALAKAAGASPAGGDE